MNIFLLFDSYEARYMIPNGIKFVRVGNELIRNFDWSMTLMMKIAYQMISCQQKHSRDCHALEIELIVSKKS